LSIERIKSKNASSKGPVVVDIGSGIFYFKTGLTNKGCGFLSFSASKLGAKCVVSKIFA
jgi:hypothetical protein